MDKDYDRWNKKKKRINQFEESPFYHEREIWWCALGVNIGSEQDGTGSNFDRPVLVIKGFNKNLLLTVALTGKKKEGKYYVYIGELEGKEATVVLSQIRIVDSKRLVRKMCTLDDNLYEKVIFHIQKMLICCSGNSLSPQERGRGRSHL
jgi:mRNA interferase MazF